MSEELAGVADLPSRFRTLIQQAGSSPEYGEGRQAEAELRVRLVLAQDKAARRLACATWALVGATFVLGAATIALVYVTALGG